MKTLNSMVKLLWLAFFWCYLPLCAFVLIIETKDKVLYYVTEFFIKAFGY